MGRAASFQGSDGPTSLRFGCGNTRIYMVARRCSRRCSPLGDRNAGLLAASHGDIHTGKLSNAQGSENTPCDRRTSKGQRRSRAIFVFVGPFVASGFFGVCPLPCGLLGTTCRVQPERTRRGTEVVILGPTFAELTDANRESKNATKEQRTVIGCSIPVTPRLWVV